MAIQLVFDVSGLETENRSLSDFLKKKKKGKKERSLSDCQFFSVQHQM